MAWFRKKNKAKELNNENIPKHIAFIADGNGRWATERGLPRFEGHKAGRETIKRVLDRCFERGVETVSLYCFSTENFSRPKEEVEYIFNLFRSMKDIGSSIIKRDARFHLMGDLSMLPSDIQEQMISVTNQTKDCKSHILNFGFAYGGRHEIVSAVNNLIKDGVKVVTEETFENLDLILCGHTHEGLAFEFIPGDFGFISPHKKLFPKNMRGLFSISNTKLIISSGITKLSECSGLNKLSNIFSSNIITISLKK